MGCWWIARGVDCVVGVLLEEWVGLLVVCKRSELCFSARMDHVAVHLCNIIDHCCAYA